jgi:8-oxo-dGTP pyrophosphatase MutT (NUDIX family)
MTIKTVRISGVDARLVTGAWPMPDWLRARVPARWAAVKAAKPATWDGRILGFSKPEIGSDGVVRMEAREDAYSAFLTWRGEGFPDFGIHHVFGTALIHSSDGALIFGVMGGDTVNAGRVYPPGGSLEPDDVDAHGLVDVEACIAREMLEETGLDAAEARKGALLATFYEASLSVSRVYHFDQTADRLVEAIRENLALQAHRELADIVACRTPEDGLRAGHLAPYAATLLDAFAEGRLPLEMTEAEFPRTSGKCLP